MNIQPLGDRVLVKVLETAETTKSGIVLPASAKEKKAEGEILALGEGEKIKALKLNKGDKVLFGKYSGDEVEMEKEEYKILEYKDVLAVVK
ncbi:MAG: co-chaperone GroES [Candidatus Kerfeldbacteria bacterium RIFOXYA2_FULL_38_24]|uniref:Co-chaperonin GroES n=1 Tax=Candidatus Kerfeldbacteria bacterium RIFOXYB2_FULL_38_14 TaxID=1798547 RepID=A0A1G2BGH3_9BACT|nr:MAG: co-chaperone GroES [Candidatus Kerfeldbacteria bacterium RIFOXYB2_FULL_38_14]OGY87959.1 MAG: co-chaperone GroES [Candidatus Kerfeldbacteria bacterium RIFOXYA2_FULL_38_24]OGY88515.1 MAG: co-chaperone GroES [Candidatus Kerfeldbacteria bacterium RIFOXYC2_FULL_38_9]